MAPPLEAMVLALGKLGSREMTAASDLDLILIYDFDAEGAESDGPRRLGAGQYYARLTQRLLAVFHLQLRFSTFDFRDDLLFAGIELVRLKVITSFQDCGQVLFFCQPCFGALLLNVGGGYLMNRTEQLDFHLAFGLNRNSPDYTIGVGYSYRWDNVLSATAGPAHRAANRH